MNTKSPRLAFVLLALVLPLRARADEGLWTFDAFPVKQVQKTYAFTPDPAWLDRVRLASARFPGSCSASFVSPEGLVLTNHHCVQQCLADLSGPGQDYLSTGFLAAEWKDERRCPDMEIDQLLKIEDVTARMTEALKDRTGRAFVEARDALKARLEQECQTSESLRCEVVTLFGGGRYHLYTYRRWDDVRLAFAPETAIAFFGGDPQNFRFPRHDLDAALVRVVDADGSSATPDFFRWSSEPPFDGQLVFVSGSPGPTRRLSLPSQLRLEREVELPMKIAYHAELRALYAQFSRRGPVQRQVANDPQLDVENSLKAERGALAGLTDQALAQHANRTEQLKGQVERDDRLRPLASAWPAIDRAMKRARELAVPYRMLEKGWGFVSPLFDHARALVRAADELQKPSGKRLPEFTEARLPELRNEILAEAPVYPEMETETLAWSLEWMRAELGVEDPAVRAILGARSPREVAESAVGGTHLGDAAVRAALLEGGATAIRASTDPMIRLALAADAPARAVRTQWEDEVDSIVEASHEAIARARFALYRTAEYPDGTLTPRLSFGAVRGWNESGHAIGPFTTFGELFALHTGRDPFAVPPRWLAAKDRLPPDTRFDVVTDNDIIGGNSGSPVIDREGRLVGVIFDGNQHSLDGDYWFDPADNRAVAVTATALLTALDTVYGAKRVVEEIRRASGATAGAPAPAGRSSGASAAPKAIDERRSFPSSPASPQR